MRYSLSLSLSLFEDYVILILKENETRELLGEAGNLIQIPVIGPMIPNLIRLHPQQEDENNPEQGQEFEGVLGRTQARRNWKKLHPDKFLKYLDKIRTPGYSFSAEGQTWLKSLTITMSHFSYLITFIIITIRKKAQIPKWNTLAK